MVRCLQPIHIEKIIITNNKTKDFIQYTHTFGLPVVNVNREDLLKLFTRCFYQLYYSYSSYAVYKIEGSYFLFKPVQQESTYIDTIDSVIGLPAISQKEAAKLIAEYTGDSIDENGCVFNLEESCKLKRQY
jgi:hypothetical protein